MATEKVRRWRGMLITLGHDRTGMWYYDLYTPQEQRLGKGDGYASDQEALAAARAEASAHIKEADVTGKLKYEKMRGGWLHCRWPEQHLRKRGTRRNVPWVLVADGVGPLWVTPAVEEIVLRPEVLRLAQEMERQLRAHADRPGWKTEPLMYLYARMLDETHELSDVLMQARDPGLVWHEAADVANMAMMVADAYEHQQAELRGWRASGND